MVSVIFILLIFACLISPASQAGSIKDPCNKEIWLWILNFLNTDSRSSLVNTRKQSLIPSNSEKILFFELFQFKDPLTFVQKL